MLGGEALVGDFTHLELMHLTAYRVFGARVTRILQQGTYIQTPQGAFVYFCLRFDFIEIAFQ